LNRFDRQEGVAYVAELAPGSSAWHSTLTIDDRCRYTAPDPALSRTGPARGAGTRKPPACCALAPRRRRAERAAAARRAG
jgi:hypothetical protein